MNGNNRVIQKPNNYINNYIYVYGKQFDLDNNIKYLETNITMLLQDNDIKQIYDEFNTNNINLDVFKPNEGGDTSECEICKKIYSTINKNRCNESDMNWPYYTQEQKKTGKNQTITYTKIINDYSKVLYDDKKYINYTFDGMLKFINDLSVLLYYKDSKKTTEPKELIQDLCYTINLLYGSAIKFITLYVTNNLENENFYNYIDFLFSDKKFKDFNYNDKTIITDNVKENTNINQNIKFIFDNKEKINNLIKIIDLIHFQCQYCMFKFFKKNEIMINSNLKGNNIEERISNLFNTTKFIDGPSVLFSFIPNKYNGVGITDYGFIDFLKKIINWKNNFYNQMSILLNLFFKLIQNKQRGILLNDRKIFDSAIDLLNKNFDANFLSVIKDVRGEKDYINSIKSLNTNADLPSFNNKFDKQEIDKLNYFITRQKIFTFEDNDIENIYNINNFNDLKQLEFGAAKNINSVKINDDDNIKNQFKNFVLTLIVILTNKLSNTKTLENNKKLIKNEFKYYLIKLYKLYYNFTKYQEKTEKEDKFMIYGKDKIIEFNKNLDQKIIKHQDQINSSNIDFINDVADFLISELNFDDKKEEGDEEEGDEEEEDEEEGDLGIPNLFEGGAEISKIKKNISDVLILALNEKGTIYWIDDDYYKLMPNEEEIYKEYLNALKEQNEEYQEIFSRVNNDAQIDPEEMSNIIKKNDKINELTMKIENLKKKLEDILKKEDRKEKKTDDKKIKKKIINDTKIRIDNNIISLIFILQELSNTDNYSSQNPRVQALLNNVISGIQNYYSSDKKNNIQSNSIIKTLEDNFINHFKSNRVGKSLNNNEMRMVDFTAQVNNNLESLIRENKIKNGDKFIVSKTNSIKDGEIYILMDHVKNENDNLVVLLIGKNPKNGNIENFKVNLFEDEYFKNSCDYAHLVLEETPKSGKNGADVLSAKYNYFNPNYNRFNF